jgi:hypothetical protein
MIRYRHLIPFDHVACRVKSLSLITYHSVKGHAVARLVEVLRYKPEGRGVYFRLLLECYMLPNIVVSQREGKVR